MARPASPPANVDEATVLARLDKLNHGRANFKTLARELGLRGEKRDELEALLERLTRRGRLIEIRGQYTLPERQQDYVVGRLNLHRDGYGFVVPERPMPQLAGDLFIAPRAEGAAMHGDRVLARITRLARGARAEGEVVEVLDRAHPSVVGEFRVTHDGYRVMPRESRLRQAIVIPDEWALPPAEPQVDRIAGQRDAYTSPDELDGLIVNVEITAYPRDEADDAVGRVIEVLGDENDFGVDVEITIRKHGLRHRFPAAVLEQARAISPQISTMELEKRRDFRSLACVTIDGETARDFDDAVYVERLPGGHYLLQVHIADVSHYVRPGSAIDEEALRRGTSVYFPDRAVPMLPLELSTGICSLKPQCDRLVMSAVLEIDAQGDVVAQEFCRGVIRSAERMTYTAVQGVLDGDAACRERYAPLVERFELMKELAERLNRRRYQRGAIDFDLPEPEIVFDAAGEMTGIRRSARLFAHRIIEEFMLAANEAVSRHLEAHLPASIFRIHEAPDPARVMEFEELALRFGHTLGLGALPVKRYAMVDRKRDGRKVRHDLERADERLTVSSRMYQRLVEKLAGRPEERILNYLMLRSLKQARYSSRNVGHFALAARSYTHFTSPIRRYPDLVVHRLLGAWLDRRAHTTPPLEAATLEPIAMECSLTERRAAEAERDLIEWKKARYMADRLGDQFPALVISTTKYGFFVELDELFVEGLVPLDTLPGRWSWQENTRQMVNERTRASIRIGDRVTVNLYKVDALENRLLFGLVTDNVPPRGKRR